LNPSIDAETNHRDPHDERKTLNDAFREWLAQYASSRSDAAGFDEFMSRIKPMRAGRHFTREEMNER